ncbi:MAG: inorganic phosphate transporter [Methanomassiliicoccales archaeon]
MESAVNVVFIFIVVILALFFCATNGFHDASSTIATLIGSRTATPIQAVLLASVSNLVGALVGGSAVVYTIQSLTFISHPQLLVICLFSATLSAVVWNIITWKYGLPSSSTHAFIGGLIGATIPVGGIEALNWGIDSVLAPSPSLDGILKVFVLLATSIVVGLAGGYLLMKTTTMVLRKSTRSANKSVRKVQWITASLLSFSHGANDTQKQISIIMIVFASSGFLVQSDVHLGIRLACALAMAVGTMFGGWRIVRTLAVKIYRIGPLHSLNSQSVSTAAVLFSTIAGAPVSTTHVVSASIIGIGTAENAKMVDWTLGKEIFVSWLLTFPITMLISGLLSLMLTVI